MRTIEQKLKYYFNPRALKLQVLKAKIVINHIIEQEKLL